MFVAVCLLIAVSTPEITGENIMLNKPSIQSSTYQSYNSTLANDGDLSACSTTGSSYWQGDLEQSYQLQRVAVTSHQNWPHELKNAYIGVSTYDVSTNPNGSVTVCGQWPAVDITATIIFTCDPPEPVRYVRIWMADEEDFLTIAEVEVYDTTTQDVKEFNLMSNKPSKQSNTRNNQHPGLAIDGNPLTVSVTYHQNDPYWQGDLKGYYFIHSIAVTLSNDFPHLKNAYIDISVHEWGQPGNIACGQWPDMALDATLLFRCDHSKAVRYIQIWRHGYYPLALAEVLVQGKPAGPLSGMKMSEASSPSRRVSTTSKSLQVNTTAECANACFRKPLCVGFSFNMQTVPSCLLTNENGYNTVQNWVTYWVNKQDLSFCP